MGTPPIRTRRLGNLRVQDTEIGNLFPNLRVLMCSARLRRGDVPVLRQAPGPVCEAITFLYAIARPCGRAAAQLLALTRSALRSSFARYVLRSSLC